MNRKMLIAFASVASLMSVAGAPVPRPVSAPPAAVGCEYVYDAKASDAFDGAALDAAKWDDWIASFQGRSSGFLFARDNVAVSNGCLSLTARLLRPEEKTVENLRRGFDTYATALVRAREKTFYGYYECRAKSMRACVCNAFWLYDPLSDQPQKKFRPGDFTEEIDIFELFGKPSPKPPAGDVTRKCYTTAHRLMTPYLEGIVNGGVYKLANRTATTTMPFDFWDGYHTYGFRWTPTDLTWYADGVELFSRTNDFFHRPMHVTFDCEIMYDWGGEPDRADLPQTFSIDYFRHWRLTDARPFEASVQGKGTVEFALANGERDRQGILLYATGNRSKTDSSLNVDCGRAGRSSLPSLASPTLRHYQAIYPPRVYPATRHTTSITFFVRTHFWRALAFRTAVMV